MNVLITICGRGGSRGIPGKNVKSLAGKPLISYSIKHAFELAKHFDAEIALSTDSNDILEVASQFGLLTQYRRPEHLGMDHVGKIDVLRDLWNWSEKFKERNFDYIIDLDITSPLRTIREIIHAFEMIDSNQKAVNLFSVTSARKNPYFNLVEEDLDGYAVISKSRDSAFLSRQASPSVFEINGSFYIYKRKFFTSDFTSAVQNNKSMIYQMDHTCFDLDEPIDFLFMEYLIENGFLDFELISF